MPEKKGGISTTTLILIIVIVVVIIFAVGFGAWKYDHRARLMDLEGAELGTEKDCYKSQSGQCKPGYMPIGYEGLCCKIPK